MYPVIRLARELALQRRASPLAVGQTHVSRHRIWPHDLDVWMELNNGRAMTLLDLGRFGLFMRMGLTGAMRRRGWAGTVAGSSVRYRVRLRAFDRIEMRSRIDGWDARFAYAEQSIWRGGTCCVHALLRLAVTDRSGLVPATRLADALGVTSPPLPPWVEAWVEADAQRPWPP